MGVENVDLKLLVVRARKDRVVALGIAADDASGPLFLIDSSIKVWRESGSVRISCTVNWMSEFSNVLPALFSSGTIRGLGRRDETVTGTVPRSFLIVSPGIAPAVATGRGFPGPARAASRNSRCSSATGGATGRDQRISAVIECFQEPKFTAWGERKPRLGGDESWAVNCTVVTGLGRAGGRRPGGWPAPDCGPGERAPRPGRYRRARS